jgi:transcriptional regulator with XRE-family HTH domain
MVKKKTKPRPRVDESERKRLKRLGAQIRLIRNEKDLTLEEAAEKGGMSWKHLQAIEYGNKNFTVTSLFRLAKAMGVDPAVIVSGIK